MATSRSYYQLVDENGKEITAEACLRAFESGSVIIKFPESDIDTFDAIDEPNFSVEGVLRAINCEVIRDLATQEVLTVILGCYPSDNCYYAGADPRYLESGQK